MNKLYLYFLFSLTLVNVTIAQQSNADSLIKLLPKINNDTVQIVVLNKIAMQLHNNQSVKSLNYAKKALELAENTKQTKYLILTYGTMAATYWALSNYSEALNYLFKKLKILEKEKEHRELAKTYKHIALVLFSSEQDSLVMMYINKSIAICEKYNFKTGIADAYNLKANIKFHAGDTGNIEHLWIKSKEIYEQNNELLKAAAIEHNLGMLFLKKTLS